MRVGWVYDRFLLRHVTEDVHPDQGERLVAIENALRSAGLLDALVSLNFDPADPEVIGWVHEPAYVELVRLACEHGFNFIGSQDTQICPDSYDVARFAVGGVLAACEAVMRGRIDSAFCAVRPPGHHAERDKAGGYCLFNNVAIAAEFLIRQHGCGRVAIVDWDVHHGNGTQHIFEARSDVLYVSLHESPGLMYPGTGQEVERGVDGGLGYTLNIVFQPGADDLAYRRAFEERVLPRLDEFSPDFVLVSAGFDSAYEDRAGDMRLTPSGFAWMTRALRDVARRHAGGRLVSVLEGGYEFDALGRCATAHVQALMAPSES